MQLPYSNALEKKVLVDFEKEHSWNVMLDKVSIEICDEIITERVEVELIEVLRQELIQAVQHKQTIK